jgi:hypothetical protein
MYKRRIDFAAGGFMKKSNWILFILLIAMSLAWGLYYWFFIVPSK